MLFFMVVHWRLQRTHEENEKLGSRIRPYGQMKIFQEALDECGLQDLGFVGSNFMCFKNYPNVGIVWERLDRAVATNEWLDLFPATKVHTLEVGSSDLNVT